MTPATPEQIIQSLKAKGLRVTPQRFAVYANLLARADHPTAEQIFLELNQQAPQTSQATVYSSLQTLRQAGLAREVLLDEGVCRYDAKVEPHHHFRCRGCGQIRDIAWEKFQCLETAALAPGLTIESYEVILQGLCGACSGESETP